MFSYRRALIFFIAIFPGLGSLAETNSGFYLKKHIGVHHIGPIKEKRENLDFQVSQTSKTSPHIGIGVGYYANDFVRIDLLSDHFKCDFAQERSNFVELENGLTTIGSINVTRKAYISTLMINTYVDLLKRDHYSFFVGAGVGRSRIKEKTNFIFSGNSVSDLGAFNFPASVEKHSTKPRNNFSYNLVAGFSIKVKPSIHLELAYKMHDFGKTKPIANINGEKTTAKRYKSDHMSLGIRFDV